ncbi:hypothetical protein D9M69_567360 [compost metagenome]
MRKPVNLCASNGAFSFSMTAKNKESQCESDRLLGCGRIGPRLLFCRHRRLSGFPRARFPRSDRGWLVSAWCGRNRRSDPCWLESMAFRRCCDDCRLDCRSGDCDAQCALQDPQPAGFHSDDDCTVLGQSARHGPPEYSTD